MLPTSFSTILSPPPQTRLREEQVEAGQGAGHLSLVMEYFLSDKVKPGKENSSSLLTFRFGKLTFSFFLSVCLFLFSFLISLSLFYFLSLFLSLLILFLFCLIQLYYCRFASAAVSCSSVRYSTGGVGFGFWLTGKLGRAWVGAWMVHGMVHGWWWWWVLMMMMWGWANACVYYNCFSIYQGISPPKEMLLSFSIGAFLTNFELTNRKQ